jgi:dTDP-4-dehydrorhamnose 3,5-epimerase
MPMPVDITETEIPGVLEVRPKIFSDDRGFFTETYNRDTWEANGFVADWQQDNLSKSRKGTLRGMHYQLNPHAMGKLVRVLSGRIFDVGVDLRRGSPTFGKWVGRELRGDDPLCLWIPAGFAHGFVALEDDTLVHYKCTATHHPETERSLHYADPAVGIAWPMEPLVITGKDAAAPTLDAAEYNFEYNA